MVQKTFKVAEIELTYSPDFKIADKPKISKSNDAFKVLVSQWNLGRIELLEEFKIILMNRRNRVIGIVPISKGGISGTVADPKVIFAAALKSCASGIILAHNHPSGELDPSTEDIKLTQKIKEGGKILDIQVLDHLIITSDKFYSFADGGLM
jgi:DNA repair protein RadC